MNRIAHLPSSRGDCSLHLVRRTTNRRIDTFSTVLAILFG